MSIKISELPQATSVGSSDIVPIVQGGATKQATAEMMNLDVYSTTEQRVGTWIDNKPIYRKVFSVTMLYNSGGSYSMCEIFPDISISLLLNCNGYVTNGSVIYFVNSPRWDNQDADITCYYIRASNKIQVSTKVDRSGYTGHIWLDYTKTTDSATRSLNLTNTANTGELVGIGNRTELTDETKNDEKQAEEQAEEQVENILEENQEENQNEVEPIETKTEGSGDER